MNEADLLKRITVNPTIFGGKPIILGLNVKTSWLVSHTPVGSLGTSELNRS